MPKIRHIASALFLLACACGPTEETPSEEERERCEVAWGEDAISPIEVRAADPTRLWEPGPHHVWSSAPADACADHPVFTSEASGEEAEIAMHVHFPADADPLAQGEASAAPGPWPVVVFIHSNLDRKLEDGSCVPIFTKYRSLHAHWASWGYVVASVDNTAQNCRRDGANLYERSQIQIDAVAALERMNADPADRLFGRIDTSRLVFAGHSRGGGSSLLSYNAVDYPVAGVIGLQPLSMTGFGSPRVDAPYIGFTAGEDVDLNYPHVEVTEEVLDGAYTMVTIYGGIHAWTGDTIPEEPDDVPLITQREQHDVTQLYTTAFLASVIGLSDGSASPTFTPVDMSDVLYGHGGARAIAGEGVSALGAATRWRAPGEDATLIDGFDRADPSTNALGGAHEVVSMAAADEVYTFKPDEESPSAGHRRATSLRLTPPQGAPGVWRTAFDPVDAPAGATLQARVKGADDEPTPSFVVVLQGGGQEQRVEVGPEHVGPEAMTNRYTQLVVPIMLGELDEVAFEVEGGPLFVDALRVVR
jgi:dienelactone hydrolase